VTISDNSGGLILDDNSIVLGDLGLFSPKLFIYATDRSKGRLKIGKTKPDAKWYPVSKMMEGGMLCIIYKRQIFSLHRVNLTELGRQQLWLAELIRKAKVIEQGPQ
jgi:hypothetical protein